MNFFSRKKDSLVCSNRQSQSPVGFWFLNDQLDLTVIDRQLDQFAAQGFAGVVPHPRDGMTTPYLSRRWFETLEYIVEGCKRRGLQVWFYDENPYPSGMAGGKLLDKYPHLGANSLSFIDRVLIPENGTICASFPEITGVLRVFAIPLDESQQVCGSFIDITEYAGLISDSWFVNGKRSTGYGPTFLDDSCQEPHWRAWQQKKIWKLEWPANDAHKWRILVVSHNRTPYPEALQNVDLLNPETTRRFIELTHKTTASKLGRDCFEQFFAAFTDEPHLQGPYPWTESLPDDYRQEYNEDLLSLLPHLTIRIDASSNLIRYRYRRLLAKLFEKHFVKPLAEYCREQSIPLTGHVSPEEDPVFSTLGAPGLTRYAAAMDWPGYDLVTLPFGTNESGKLLGPKLISSVAHQHGKDHLMTEAFGCCGDNLTIKQMHRMTNWLAVCGYDKFVIHGQFMSLDGHRKREAPPSIFYQAPYWQHFHELSGYINSVSDWNSKGDPVRPIVVLQPNAAFEAWFPDDNKHSITLAQNLSEIVGDMTAAGLDFDLVSDYDLAEAKIITTSDGSAVQIGQAVYKTLILPDVSILDEATNDFLQKCVAQGVNLESLTERIDTIGLENDTRIYKQTVSGIKELIRKLCRQYRQWLELPKDRRLYVQTRIIDSRLERMLWNPDEQPLSITLADNETLSYKSPDNSTPRSVRRISTNLSVELEPLQLLILTEESAAANSLVTLPPMVMEETANWDDNWVLIPEDSNSLLLSQWQLELTDGTSDKVSLPSRSGELLWGLNGQTVTMRCEVIIDGQFDNAELWWDRSTFNGDYKISVNGKDIGPVEHVAKHDLYEQRAKIGDAIQPGINCFEIKIGPIPSDQPAMLDPLRLEGLFRVIRTCCHNNDEALDVRPSWLKQMLVDDITLPRIAPVTEKIALDKPADWATLGFPQFSGTMTYRTTLQLAEITGRVFLEASPEQTDAFEVKVNGKIAGTCCWQPFRVEITDLLEKGKNNIEIRVSNTSINRTEGKAQPSGLLGPLRVVALPKASATLSDIVDILTSQQKPQKLEAVEFTKLSSEK